MRRLFIVLFVVIALTLATVAPALAIVDPVAPICTGEGASGGAAGGAAAVGVVKSGGAGEASNGPPFPAKGTANSDGHACP